MSIRNYLAFLLLVLSSACQTTRKAVYFSDSDTASVITIPDPPEARIHPDDILAINVTSESSIGLQSDPVAIFKEGGINQSVAVQKVGSGGSSNIGQSTGFLVDDAGNIEFPVLGKIGVGGKTVREAKLLISQLLSTQLKKPVVDVRITNFKVSVIGEVTTPGFIVAPNQRMTILEALAAAGDINITGRKDNIMVIRQNDERQEIGYIDLTKRSAFSSPYFNLKQNDIINVSPSVVRTQDANAFIRIVLPTFTALVSAALAVYGLVQISKK